MNAPIASKRLAPAGAELVKRVPFYPDETTFSYVNRIACLTAAVSRRRVVEMLFGSPTIHTERPLHCGFGHLAALHADADGEMPTNLPLRLGMLALYAPFVDAERLHRAMDMLHGTQFNGVNETVGRRATGVFRENPAFCPECLKEDVSCGRPAHFRRVPLISAVTCCPTHGTALASTCRSCGAEMSHEQRPALNCRRCGASFEHDESFPDSRASVQWRLAKFLEAAVLGTLPNVDAEIRLGALRARVARDIKNRSGTVGDNLARELNHAYGQPFLRSLELPTDSAPTLAWPALYLEGRLFVNDPIASCLILALIFDSIEDYAREIADAVRLGIRQPLGRNLSSATSVTMAVLKDLLRPMSVEAVAKHHSIASNDLKKWVAAVPGFSKRRQISRVRVKLRNSQKSILLFLDQHPSSSRYKLAAELKSDLEFVRINDGTWLDRHIPSRISKPHSGCRD